MNGVKNFLQTKVMGLIKMLMKIMWWKHYAVCKQEKTGGLSGVTSDLL